MFARRRRQNERAMSYVAGTLESVWANAMPSSWPEASQWRLWCGKVIRQGKSAELEQSLRFAASSRGPSPVAASTDELQLLARLVNPSTGCSDPIEPLSGTARHPIAFQHVCHSHHKTQGVHLVDFMNSSQLILANHCGKRSSRGCFPIGGGHYAPNELGKPQRSLYYDLGCAQYSINPGTLHSKAMAKVKKFNRTYEDAVRHVLEMQDAYAASAQAAMGPSIPLFRSLYRRNCIEFDHIFGWEAKRIPNWWQRVPASERNMVTFYNEPVNATDASALGVLRRTAKPSDFVVLKLDIDTPSIENEIISTIIRDPSLSSLIDELFFEFHLHDMKLPDVPAAAAGAVRTMAALRKLGIRAHFWV